MENIEKCECVIGVLNDYKSQIVTVDELKEYIRAKNLLSISCKNNELRGLLFCKYSLDDYCDRRKSTNLTRFNYCPLCGKKIDWKALKGGANG